MGDARRRRRERCGPSVAYRCWPLDERLADEANARVKGLALCVVTLRDLETQRVVAVTYRRTPHDVPLVLKFCPWCGTELQEESIEAARERCGTARES